jgi:uncharacterized protein YidB (DUF937 family)
MTGSGQQQGGMGTKGALMMALLSMMMNKGASASQGGGGLGNILGSLTGGAGQSGGGLGSILGGMLGGGGSQASAAAPAANLEGALGGLSGIQDLFRKAGLGDHVASWIGNGDNKPVSADQIKQALGASGHLGQLAQAAGVSEDDAAHHLTELLPEIVNKLTPQGSIPAGGGDIVGMLKQMMG